MPRRIVLFRVNREMHVCIIQSLQRPCLNHFLQLGFTEKISKRQTLQIKGPKKPRKKRNRKAARKHLLRTIKHLDLLFVFLRLSGLKPDLKGVGSERRIWSTLRKKSKYRLQKNYSF